MITTLIETNKDIISALYFTKKEKNKVVKTIPVAFIDTKVPGKVTHLSLEQAFIDQIKEIRAGGFGCILLSKKAFENIPCTMDEDFKGGEDTYFFMQAQEKGFQTFLNTSVRCKHLIMKHEKKWKDVKY